MPKRRMLWQLYPSYLVITLLTVLGLGWLATHWFEQFYRQNVWKDLEHRAAFVELQISDEVPLEPPARLLAEGRHWAQMSGARLTLVRSDGTVIWDSDRPAADMENQASRPEFRQAVAGENAHWTRYQPTHDQHLAFVALPVRRSGSVCGVVQAAAPLAAVDEAMATIQLRATLVGLTIALLATAMSLLVSRQISRPLEEMRHGAERFARGELGYKLLVPDSEELAGLAEALNQMAEQLQERISIIVRQNNEQRAVLGSMVEGVMAVDNQQRIISLNKATGLLLGIDQQQAQGRPLQEVVRNTDLRRFITRALNCNEPIDDDVVVHGNHEGVLQARGAALHDAQGRGIGAVVVLNDVTDFRRLETIRRDFVANVSHELKTPVTSIKGFAETLLDGAMHNPVDTERFLTIMAKQADRLNAIIDDLLSLSKIEQGEDAADIVLTTGSVKDVIDSAVANCDARAQERQIKVCAACDETVLAEINDQLLEQAVVNLLDNAIKYSEPGGEVQVLGSQSDAEVTITVSDHGVGIAAEHLSRVFERFYRVDKARSRKLGGTGLGLAIVKHIIQAHHGHVTVKSILAAGSVFTIHLPLPGQHALARARDGKDAKEPANGKTG